MQKRERIIAAILVGAIVVMGGVAGAWYAGLGTQDQSVIATPTPTPPNPSVTLTPASNASVANETGNQAITQPLNQTYASWTLNVTGIQNRTFTLEEIRSMPNATENCTIYSGVHTVNATYKGVSVQYLLDLMNVSNVSIEIIGIDGTSVNFTSAEIASSNQTIILAYERDGFSLKPHEENGTGPLRLIVPQKDEQFWVKNVVQVEIKRITTAPVSSSAYSSSSSGGGGGGSSGGSTPQSYTLSVTGSGITAEKSFTLSEIEAMPAVTDDYYIKVGHGKESWTATYTGVSVWHLLNEEVGLKNPENVKIIAEDGYIQMFSIEDIKESYSGKEIILAYERDGARLTSREENGTGPLRLIVPQRFEGEYNGQFCVMWVNEVEVTGGTGGGGGDGGGDGNGGGGGDGDGGEDGIEGSLTVQGAVEQSRVFTVTEIREMPNITDQYTLRTSGGIDYIANYTGVSMWYLLNDTVGLKEYATSVKVVATDGYLQVFTLDGVNKTYWNGKRMILAYDAEGEALGEDEGPLRLIRPQKYEGDFNAMYCVKWVNEIDVLPIYYDVDLSVDSTEKVTSPGMNATYTLTVKNKGTKTDDYTLSISNPDNASVWLSKDGIENLPAGSTERVLLNVTSTFDGLFRVNVTATSENDHFVVDCVNTTTTIGGLMISGRVSQERFFNLTEIRGMQNITDSYTLRSGKGNYTANYTGVLLAYLLKEEADMIGEENYVNVIAADGYSRTFLFGDMNKTYWNGKRLILAYDEEGVPLGEDDGPLRLIRPQEYEGDFNAMYCVKQVNRIVVIPVYDVDFSLDSSAKRTTENKNATYTLTVENAGMQRDTYILSISNPDNASVWLSKDRIENLPAGSNETVLLNVTSASKGLFKVDVTATSEGDPFARDYVNTTTTVADLILCGALNQERFFNLTEIRGMQNITDSYTLRSGKGNHTANYTGVSLSYLLKEAGMISEENYVNVIASDGYSRTFLFDDVNKTYWNETRMILAYDEEGVPLGEDDGPLRLIRPQEYEGDFNTMYCVRQVAEIFVFPEGRLNVTGAVASNTTFTTAEIRDMPYVIHIGNKSAQCEHNIWTGVSLKHLLYDEVGMKDYATSVNVIASDGYHREFDIEQITAEEPGNTTMILAYDENGACILSKENGGNGPLRLVVPTEHHPSYCVKWVTDIEVLGNPPVFDTEEPEKPYPSISGMHNGTIRPSQTITVNKLYTYPCPGTGGHTEYVRIWNSTWEGVDAHWEGYKGDWHTITFNKPFALVKNETYNCTIRTGSYPQIIHAEGEFNATGGKIACTEFVDANGKRSNGGIPAIKLFWDTSFVG